METGTVTEIARLANGGAGATVDMPNGAKAMLIPPDWTVKELPPVDPILTHTKQVVSLADQDSFVSYIGEHKIEATRLFVDIDRATMSAVFDYHSAAASGSAGGPGRLAHRAVYAMKQSEEWKRWTAIDGTFLPQMNFARFIEENAIDVVTPSSAEMLEIALHLQVKKKVHFESGVRLQDGRTNLTYKEDIESGGRNDMKVVTEFEIGIPVFFLGEPYKIKCFLRFDIEDGKLKFKIDMNRRQHIYHDAVMASAKSVAASQGLTPFFGNVG